MSENERQPAAPLKPNIFLILMSLVDGQAHGYEIRKDVERRSGGSVCLDPGTLYRHIGNLLDESLIEESDDRPEDDDPRRRYYRLTEEGIEAVEAEADRMAELVEEVRAGKRVRARGGAR